MIKRILIITGIILGILLLLIGIFAAYIYIAPEPSHKKIEVLDIEVEITPERIAKGKVLVLSNCQGCHGNKNGELVGKKLNDVKANKAFGTHYASNITNHKEFGIGDYTDGELYRLLRTGVKKDNKLAAVVMPKWSTCAPDDIYNMIAFLKSDDNAVKASDNELPKHKASFLERALKKFAFKPTPYQEDHLRRPLSNDSIALGKYLVEAIYGCFFCHSGDLEKASMLDPEATPNYLGGGYEFHLEEYKIRVPSLLMEGDSNISTWSVEQFIRAMKDGVRPNVDKPGFLEPMHTYPLLDTVQYKAIYAYLKDYSKRKKNNQKQLSLKY